MREQIDILAYLLTGLLAPQHRCLRDRRLADVDWLFAINVANRVNGTGA